MYDLRRNRLVVAPDRNFHEPSRVTRRVANIRILGTHKNKHLYIYIYIYMTGVCKTYMLLKRKCEKMYYRDGMPKSVGMI